MASEQNWRAFRILLRLGLIAWFAIIAFWFGPHLILFRKLSSMSPADFVPVVQKFCVPTVRAMKQYAHDHGRMANKWEDLGPAFDPHIHKGPGMDEIDSRGYTYWAFGIYNHHIEYDFTSGHEGWRVHGAFANGPVPVPSVNIESTSQP